MRNTQNQMPPLGLPQRPSLRPPHRPPQRPPQGPPLEPPLGGLLEPQMGPLLELPTQPPPEGLRNQPSRHPQTAQDHPVEHQHHVLLGNAVNTLAPGSTYWTTLAYSTAPASVPAYSTASSYSPKNMPAQCWPVLAYPPPQAPAPTYSPEQGYSQYSSVQAPAPTYSPEQEYSQYSSVQAPAPTYSPEQGYSQYSSVQAPVPTYSPEQGYSQYSSVQAPVPTYSPEQGYSQYSSVQAPVPTYSPEQGYSQYSSVQAPVPTYSPEQGYSQYSSVQAPVPTYTPEQGYSQYAPAQAPASAYSQDHAYASPDAPAPGYAHQYSSASQRRANITTPVHRSDYNTDWTYGWPYGQSDISSEIASWGSSQGGGNHGGPGTPYTTLPRGRQVHRSGFRPGNPDTTSSHLATTSAPDTTLTYSQVTRRGGAGTATSRGTPGAKGLARGGEVTTMLPLKTQESHTMRGTQPSMGLEPALPSAPERRHADNTPTPTTPSAYGREQLPIKRRMVSLKSMPLEHDVAEPPVWCNTNKKNDMEGRFLKSTGHPLSLEPKESSPTTDNAQKATSLGKLKDKYVGEGGSGYSSLRRPFGPGLEGASVPHDDAQATNKIKNADEDKIEQVHESLLALSIKSKKTSALSDNAHKVDSIKNTDRNKPVKAHKTRYALSADVKGVSGKPVLPAVDTQPKNTIQNAPSEVTKPSVKLVQNEDVGAGTKKKEPMGLTFGSFLKTRKRSLEDHNPTIHFNKKEEKPLEVGDNRRSVRPRPFDDAKPTDSTKNADKDKPVKHE